MSMHSYGSALYYGDSSATVTTELTQIVNFDWTQAVKVCDNTHLKSTGAQRTTEPGMDAAPEMTFTGRFVKGNITVIQTTLRDGTTNKRAIKWWKAVDADGSYLLGQGYVSNFRKSVPDDDEVNYDVTITAAGAWTFTPAP
jgi:predicted secreted protein